MRTAGWFVAGFCWIALESGANPVFAQSERAPLELTVFASGPSEVMSLLYLEKHHPGLFKVNFNYFAEFDEKADKFVRPGTEADSMEYLRTLYVRRAEPDKFYDYAQCLQHDSLGGACGPLLGLDFSKFNAKVPELLDALKASAGEARKLEVYDPTPAVFINGKPYYRELFLASLLPYLNSLLPQDRRLAGIDVRPAALPVKLYAVALASGVGARDKRWESLFLRNVPDAEVVALDSESPESKSFLKEAGTPALPAYFFDKNLKKRPETLNLVLKRGLASEKNGYYPAGREEGARALLGRPGADKTLTLFVMSQCPFGVQAEDEVLKAIQDKKLPSGFKLDVRFIVSPDPEKKGEWSSLHGPAEVAEDVRQAVIRKHAPEKFAVYLRARNPDYRSEKWEEAAQKAGIDPKFISDRLQEGTKLLEDDYKETAALGISASPTYVWENRYLLGSKSDLAGFLGAGALGAGESAMAGSAPGASCQ